MKNRGNPPKEEEVSMAKDAVLSRREMLKKSGIVAAGVAAAPLVTVTKASAAKSKKRLAFVIDLRKCVGCRTCTIACKTEYGVALGRWNAVIKPVDWGTYPNNRRAFLPRMCNHCAGEVSTKGEKSDVPPCVEVCPEAKSGERAKFDGVRYRTGATYKRPDGAILIDMKHCIGCYKCIKACPYGVRSIDPFSKLDKPNREKDFGIGKCTFCVHRTDQGIAPSCVQACPQYARHFGDMNDPGSTVAILIKKHGLTRAKNTLKPDKKTAPNVYFIDPDGLLGKYKVDSDDEAKKLAEFRDKIV
jgi:tetrathionate reductase subunit B